MVFLKKSLAATNLTTIKSLAKYQQDQQKPKDHQVVKL